MKYFYFLIMILLFTSMCVGMSDIPLPGINSGQDTVITGDGQYLQIDVDTIPNEIVPGRSLTMIFQVTNNNDFDINGIDIEAYDTCIFDDNGQYKETINLKSKQTTGWTWEWTAMDTRLEKNCEIKLGVSYESEYTMYKDIVIFSYEEYLSRQAKGTLNDIPIRSSSSRAPFSLSLTFPEGQPFIDEVNDYSMKMEFYSVGDGFLEINKDDIDISMPNGISMNQDADCNGYFESKAMRFINDKAPTAICSFDVDPINQPLKIDTMQITVPYRYTIDKTVNVRVVPKA